MPEENPVSPNHDAGASQWTPPAPEHLHAMLPQYDEWVMIGCGGMGAVYRARQVSLDRPVAIKVLPPLGGDDAAEFAHRFKNEARTMARLGHPAIVAVHDFGETQDGLLYFAMEYIDGTDVFKMIHQQGRLPPEHALSITAHVCDALAYAHEHKVIHRDIKPANILINMEGAVKVADFGLASRHDPTQEGGAQEGSAMGTPDFVAPEVLRLGAPVDGRADLYAVGVMLHNMLTGEIPRHAGKPASQKCGCDPRFDAIIRKAMEHDVTQRYQSAREIRRDLDRILAVPVAKQQAAQQPQVRGGMQPRPVAIPQQPPPKGTPWGLIAAAVVVLGGAAAFFLKSGGSSTAAGRGDAARPVPSASSSASSGSKTGDTAAEPTPAPAPVVIQNAPQSFKGSPLSQLPVLSHGGHYYQVVDAQTNFNEAQRHAASLGAHLLTISSQEEMDWLDQALPPLLRKVPQWMATIGARRENGAWTWVTGEPWKFTRWDDGGAAAAGEPQKNFALKLTAKGDTRAVWGTGHFDGSRSFIIEWDGMPQSLPAPVVATPSPVPAPTPSVPAPVAESGAAKRLRELETQFRAALERDVLSTHRNALADLNTKYPAALDRALATAANPAETEALHQEKQRLQDNTPLPTEDPADLAAPLKPLRSTYRATLRPLDLARHNGIINFFLRYEEVLKGLEAEWKTSSPGDARLAAERLAKMTRERVAMLDEAKELVPDGREIVLKGSERFTTPESFQPPVEITIVAKTERRNLRLAYTATAMIFNWEVNPDDLRMSNDFGGARNEPTQGRIPEDTFVTIQWRVLPHMQSVSVDGRRRLLHYGDYSKLNKPVGVFTYDSKVTLKSLQVRLLDLQALEDQVSSVPEVKDLLVNNADWTGKVELPAGTYRPLRRINIGAPGKRDPKAQNDEQRCDVTSQPGTRIENVRFHLKEGSWKAAGGLFRDVKITADLGGSFEASNSLFQDCVFGKEGPWYVAWFSSKWNFSNCVFTGSFMQNWRLGDVGMKLNACTFHDVDFIPVGFKEDAGAEVSKDWLSIQNCRFVRCRVPESFALATKNCVFEKCTFGAPEEKLPLKSPLSTTLFLQDGINSPQAGTGRILNSQGAEKAPAGVGAAVKHRREGSTLTFE
ncbi:MAG: protein kinase domain-containing protein [Prosthecobacter sp.]